MAGVETLVSEKEKKLEADLASLQAANSAIQNLLQQKEAALEKQATQLKQKEQELAEQKAQIQQLLSEAKAANHDIDVLKKEREALTLQLSQRVSAVSKYQTASSQFMEVWKTLQAALAENKVVM